MERSALLFRAPSTLQFTRWCKCAAWKRATPLSAERVESKKKKRKKGKLERLFTLSPASPRSSDSLRVSLGCHGYPEDSKPRRNCLHWMTAAEARAAWTEVFSERDRIDPELPGEKGAQKSTSPSFKCHAPGSDCQPWPMLFLRTAFRNVASLNVAWRSQVWQGPRAHSPRTEERGAGSGVVSAASLLRYSSPSMRTFPENDRKLGGAVWHNLSFFFQDATAAYLPRGCSKSQSSSVLHVKVSLVIFPQNSGFCV